jgi:archaellum component FlaC
MNGERKKTAEQSVSIAAGHNKPTLSKAQRYFNSLVKQIGTRRSRLECWDVQTPLFQKKFVDEMLPLRRADREARTRLVHRLDDVHREMTLTATERRTVSGLIVEMARDLLEAHDDASLKPIYNRHAKTDYDADARTDREHMKMLMEAAYGVEFGDDVDLSSHEAFMRHATQKFDELRAEKDAQRQARQARRDRRKKTPKQMEAQARKDAQQAEVTQSIRDVYRKLASALHPDREPDAEERVRKTALMQRANQAYAKNNLLQLLELQLELEHIDQHAINGIGEERLTHYNKMLFEQLGELDREINRVEEQFRATYGPLPHAYTSPSAAVSDLAEQITALRAIVDAFENDLRQLSDERNVRAWLKETRKAKTNTRQAI